MRFRSANWSVWKNKNAQFLEELQKEESNSHSLTRIMNNVKIFIIVNINMNQEEYHGYFYRSRRGSCHTVQ